MSLEVDSSHDRPIRAHLDNTLTFTLARSWVEKTSPAVWTLDPQSCEILDVGCFKVCSNVVMAAED